LQSIFSGAPGESFLFYPSDPTGDYRYIGGFIPPTLSVSAEGLVFISPLNMLKKT